MTWRLMRYKGPKLGYEISPDPINISCFDCISILRSNRDIRDIFRPTDWFMI